MHALYCSVHDRVNNYTQQVCNEVSVRTLTLAPSAPSCVRLGMLLLGKFKKVRVYIPIFPFYHVLHKILEVPILT